jgi:hypothetical protein
MLVILSCAIIAFLIGYRYGKSDGSVVAILCGLYSAGFGAVIGTLVVMVLFSTSTYEEKYIEKEKLQIISLSFKVSDEKKYSPESGKYEPTPFYFYHYVAPGGYILINQVRADLVRIVEENRPDMYIAKMDKEVKSKHEPFVRTFSTGGYAIHAPIGTMKNLLK